MKKLKDLKFKDMILHNFALKILAVLIAIILWIVIVNVDDPSRTVTISGIQVNLLNEDALTSKGYTYAVQSGASISVTIKAPQTVVENLEASDFYAYADLSELSPSSDKAKIYVRCDKSEVSNQVDIVSLKTEYIRLTIDNKVTQDFEIGASYEGNPASGYVVGDCYVSPATVTVTGAEAIVTSIAAVKVDYNIENLAHSVNEEVNLKFYNEDGNEVSTDLLSLSRTTAKLYVEILPTKTVDINYAVSGDPADGYTIASDTPSMTSITLAATSDTLSSISSIDIPSDVIDVTGISENKTFDIPLSIYIPSGVKIVSSSSTLSVTVTLNKEQEFKIPYENIDLLNSDESKYNYEIVHKDENLVITVAGTEEDMESLDTSDLYVTASVNGKTAGTYKVKVSVECDDKYTIVGTYEITVKITENETDGENQPSEDDSTEESEDETTEDAKENE